MWRSSPLPRSFPRLLLALASLCCLYLPPPPVYVRPCNSFTQCASSAPSFAVASPLSAGDEEASPVLDLSPNDLQTLLEIENEGSHVKRRPLLFVAFVAPWCGHCRALHGPFHDAAEVYVHQIHALRASRHRALAAFRSEAARAVAEAEASAAAAETRLLSLKQQTLEEDVQKAEAEAVKARQAVAALKRRLGEEERRLQLEDSRSRDVYPDVLFGRFDCFASREAETICQSAFQVDRYPTLLLLRSLADLGGAALARASREDQAKFPAARISAYPAGRPRTSAAIVDFLLKATADHASLVASLSPQEREGNGFFSWLSRRLEGESVRIVSGAEELRVLLRPASADFHVTDVSFLLCLATRENGALSAPLEQVHAAVELFAGVAKRENAVRHFLVTLDAQLCTQFLDVLQLPHLFQFLATRNAESIEHRDTPAVSRRLLSELRPALTVAAVQPELHLPAPFWGSAREEEGGGASADEEETQRTTRRRLQALQVVLSEVWADQVRTRVLRREREEATCQREKREGRSGRGRCGVEEGGKKRRGGFCLSSLPILDDLSLMVAPLFTGPFGASADTTSSPLEKFLRARSAPVLPLVSQENFLNLRSSKDRTLVLLALDLRALDWMSELNTVALTAVLLKTLIRLKRGKWREELLPSFREAEAAETGEKDEDARAERDEAWDDAAVLRSIVAREDLILSSDDVLLIDPSADPRDTLGPGAWKPDDANEMETLLLVEKIWKLTKVASCMYTAERQSVSPFPRGEFAQASSAGLTSFTFGIVDGLMFSDSLEEYGVYAPGDLPAVLAFPPLAGSDRKRSAGKGDEPVHRVYRDKERLTLDSLFRGLQLLEAGELEPQVEGSVEGEGQAPVVRFVLQRWRQLRKWLKSLKRDASRSWPDFIRIVLGLLAFALILVLTVILLISTVCCGGGAGDGESVVTSDDEDFSTDEEDADEFGGAQGETADMPTLEEVKRRAERMLRNRRRRVAGPERHSKVAGAECEQKESGEGQDKHTARAQTGDEQ
ncbi:thioredoxin domain protein [Toxoplasma gondii MAS]|uniref:Thioredoxin domain protein n=1 Tax=Toxoplasma gondii MAS TaxID=943118 RepID=A0A086QKS1_TOXGO|nr:thioredoxin domain protein [Toxoplasma gondii MAS]